MDNGEVDRIIEGVLPDLRAPLLIVNAVDDHAIPVTEAEQIKDKATADVEVVMFRGRAQAGPRRSLTLSRGTGWRSASPRSQCLSVRLSKDLRPSKLRLVAPRTREAYGTRLEGLCLRSDFFRSTLTASPDVWTVDPDPKARPT